MLVLKRNFSALLLTLLFTLSFGGWARAGVACYSAHALPPSLAKLEKVLDRKIQVRRLLSRDGYRQIDLFTDQQTVMLGSLAYRSRAGGQVLDIFIINAEIPKIGIGKALVEQALLKFPNTKVIVTWALSGANKRELKNALKEKDATVLTALQRTPSYKIGAEFGFTEIMPETITPGFDFAVRKPTPPTSQSFH